MKPSRQKISVFCSSCYKKCVVRKDTFDANVRRNGGYLCHHCATKRAGAEGKYSHTWAMRSEQSKKTWQNEETRQKITEASIKNSTSDSYRKSRSDETTNLWKGESYRESISIGVRKAMESLDLRSRISESLRKRYASDPEYRKAVGEAARERFTDDEFRRRMALIRSNQPRISSIQNKLYSFLDDLNVEYFQEGSKTTIGWYCFDCLIPKDDGGILIECQGDYWHSLSGTEQRDRAKFTYIDKYFPEYEVMYVWEREFATHNRVLDRLKTKLGIDIETVDFAFSDVVLSKDVDVREFLDSYHYIGGNKGGTPIVATIDGIIIACALFSKPLRQNMPYQNAVELSRFCIHPSYHKKNFASWFISRCVQIIDKTIIAYADTTVGHHGTIYKASNFEFSHEVVPDYWYVDTDGYIMHKKTLYNKAVNLKMKEKEFAQKYGYVRRYGGKKLCFIKKK